jgi:hypothetical protein
VAQFEVRGEGRSQTCPYIRSLAIEITEISLHENTVQDTIFDTSRIRV